uniref:Methyl-accepting chemotaxis protein n=1 Tax=Echinostoma caproni TaxID=27848 RepID=A0A183AQW1_9TREM
LKDIVSSLNGENNQVEKFNIDVAHKNSQYTDKLTEANLIKITEENTDRVASGSLFQDYHSSAGTSVVISGDALTEQANSVQTQSECLAEALKRLNSTAETLMNFQKS